eukprot:scaffold2277_cov256-Pinguiococcus_pyrenoidosus.AAC.24
MADLNSRQSGERSDRGLVRNLGHILRFPDPSDVSPQSLPLLWGQEDMNYSAGKRFNAGMQTGNRAKRALEGVLDSEHFLHRLTRGEGLELYGRTRIRIRPRICFRLLRTCVLSLCHGPEAAQQVPHVHELFSEASNRRSSVASGPKELF